MDTNIKTIEHVNLILDEIHEAFFDIPFDNSAYQTEVFVLAASITPERAYRSIGLRMSAKIRALQESQHTLAEHQIDVDETTEKIAAGKLDKFEIRREKIKQEKAIIGLQFSSKLVNDSIIELNILYKHFKALPKFTREQFEAGERRHFTERLTRQHSLSGDQQSLINMDEDTQALLSFEKETEFIDNIDEETLQLLHKKSINIRENQQEYKEKQLK